MKQICGINIRLKSWKPGAVESFQCNLEDNQESYFVKKQCFATDIISLNKRYAIDRLLFMNINIQIRIININIMFDCWDFKVESFYVK